MSVGICIIGLPNSGRTTVFNALTRSNTYTNNYISEVPHIGVSSVVDPRLDKLIEVFKPKKTVPADVKYLDIGTSTKNLGRDTTISGEYLSQLSNADALMDVARAFTDESVPHTDGSVDVERDIITTELELAYSDLVIIERRLNKIEISLKSAKTDEKQHFQHEQKLLAKVKSGLESDVPIREQGMTKDEMKFISGYQFLSAKPLLTLVNIGDEQIAEAKILEQKLKQRFAKSNHGIVTLCGKLEMELWQLDEPTAVECRKEFGLAETGLEKTIKASFDLMNLITFFSTASEEVRAWPIVNGTHAVMAARKIHTDMGRGFIRAEVISFNDLIKAGSLAEGRKHGLLRLEGKHYIVQDGDVISFLFNV